MSLSADIVVLVSLAYVLLLFGIAFYGDWRAANGRLGWLNSPLVYTLSISIYCTSWTFYGAVGSAARSGLEFATIYLGPTLVFVGWWVFLRKMVRIGNREGVTSIADFLSARYGKSQTLAAVATLIAVVATLPYIALQLKALAASYQLITNADAVADAAFSAPVVDDASFRTAFWMAAGLAVFTILFGTRNLDARERHHGLVAAIALEAVVKLVALVTVGVFALFLVGEGPSDVLERATPELLHSQDAFGARWVAVTFLAAAAVICLPRQFQVTVVECVDEDHGRTASWAFPLYLFFISLFVLPIAIAGLTVLPSDAEPDLFVLTLPLYMDAPALALFVFLGGFSSATSMVIVACIALSTMVSNHLVMPLALGASRRFAQNAPASGDVRRFLLGARRISICAILFLGFLYFRLSGAADGLASIGLIAFAGVAQLLPPIVAAMYWPRANARGALMGLLAGAAVWLSLLFAPSVLDGDMTVEFMEWLGLGVFDPLVSTLFWSLSLNTVCLVLGSLSRAPSVIEQRQGVRFVDVFRLSDAPRARDGAVAAHRSELFVVAQRILGAAPALKLFEEERARQGLREGLPQATPAFVERVEQHLARSVGAASARTMLASTVTREAVSVDALMGMADETARLVDYSLELREKSSELERTAAQLREANNRLKRLDLQKDEFLSQISHELRTPMTALRSFSEILLETPDLPPEQARRFLGIIHDESLRLTRLLDQILDLGQLERGELRLNRAPMDPEAEIDKAIATCASLAGERRVRIHRDGPDAPVRLDGDADRLRQVYLNVIANAVKYNDSADPAIWVSSRCVDGVHETRVADNGPGVPEADRDIIFSRFARGAGAVDLPGAGLGLAITRQIVDAHGGSIALVSQPDEGATFLIRIPLAPTAPAERDSTPPQDAAPSIAD